MSEWVEGVDNSVYQGSVSQATWDALYAQGQRVACVGSAHPRPNPYALENLRRAKQAGFLLATYAVVYDSVRSAQTVGVAKQMCGEFWPELRFVGVDCETPNITEAQIHGMVTAIEAEHLRPVIYTGAWWWQGHFGDSPAFKHLPLWTASYRNPANSDTVPLYGGWTRDKLIGHQWAGSVTLASTTVDRNNFVKEFIMPPPAGPTPEQRLLALSWLANAAEAIAQGRPLTQTQKDRLKFLGS